MGPAPVHRYRVQGDEAMNRDEYRRLLKAAFDDTGRSQSWLGAEIARMEGSESPVAQSQVARYISAEHIPEPARVFAIEKALGLKAGALSHLLGYVPTGFTTPLSVGDAVALDLDLTAGQREDLTGMWEQMRKSTRARRES